MVKNAQKNDLLSGLAPDLFDKGVSTLQYVDAIVLCIDHDPYRAINLKPLLYIF
jgi:hypothetical protein